MKLNKQILEAINRGIKLALDDFDDNEIQDQEPILSKKKVLNYDAKDDFDLYNYTVDLGLPSGTLWAIWNLGCKKINDFGNFYAWGEIKKKKYYDWDHYKHAKSKYNIITKYCVDNFYVNPRTTPDGIRRLRPEDDAAYNTRIFKEFKFRIPTKEQFEELIEYCDQNYVNFTYNTNKSDELNLAGVIFKSKINGNILFLPANGFYKDTNWASAGAMGMYWTSDLSNYNTLQAYALTFNQTYKSLKIKTENRLLGCQIRPVINL